jgi:hypothetical protein
MVEIDPDSPAASRAVWSAVATWDADSRRRRANHLPVIGSIAAVEPLAGFSPHPLATELGGPLVIIFLRHA